MINTTFLWETVFIQHTANELSRNPNTFHIWSCWIYFWSSYLTSYLHSWFFCSIWLLADLPGLFCVIWLWCIWLNPFNWRILSINFNANNYNTSTYTDEIYATTNVIFEDKNVVSIDPKGNCSFTTKTHC